MARSLPAVPLEPLAAEGVGASLIKHNGNMSRGEVLLLCAASLLVGAFLPLAAASFTVSLRAPLATATGSSDPELEALIDQMEAEVLQLTDAGVLVRLREFAKDRDVPQWVLDYCAVRLRFHVQELRDHPDSPFAAAVVRSRDVSRLLEEHEAYQTVVGMRCIVQTMRTLHGVVPSPPGDAP